jgi:hypothetical protein
MLLSEQAPGLAMAGFSVVSRDAAGAEQPVQGVPAVHRGGGDRSSVHGMRYTFTDLVRRANVAAVVRRALTGHVTVEMQRHDSHVSLDEKRAAVAGVLKLVPTGGER